MSEPAENPPPARQLDTRARSTRGRLLIDLGWYSLVPVSQKIVALALLPIYTFYLGVAEYGTIALVGLAVAFVSQLSSPGIAYSVQRDYLDYTGDGAREYLFTAAVFNVVVTGAVYATFYAAARGIIPLVFPTWQPQYWYYLGLGLVTQYLLDSTIVVTTWLVVTRRSRFYAMIQLGVTVASAALQVFLLVWGQLGILAIFYGQLFSAVLTALIGFGILVPTLKPRLRVDAVGRILEYTWQLFPTNVIGYFLRRTDRLMIQAMLPIGALGLYAFGARAQLAMQIYTESVKKAWRPVYLRQLKDSAPRSELISFGNMVFELSLLVALGLMMFTKEALQLLTAPAYHAAYGIASLLIAQTFFQTIVPFVGANSLIYEKKLYLTLVTTIVTAGVSVMLSWILIPRIGVIGAAVAGCAAFAVFAAMQSIFAVHFTSAGCVVDWRRWIGLLIVASAAVVPIFVDPGLGFWGLALLKLVLLLSFAGVVVLLERDRLLAMLQPRAPALHAFLLRSHLSRAFDR